MATAEVLRAHNILLPAPHRIRPAPSHRRPSTTTSSSGPAGGATRRSSPPAGRRNHHGRKAAARPAAYAGPAFSTSPEPSALPLPQFPLRKAAAAVDAAATRDLRRILRLE
ncbi:unnamed protein product [Urochloa humidicola]